MFLELTNFFMEKYIFSVWFNSKAICYNVDLFQWPLLLQIYQIFFKSA